VIRIAITVATILPGSERDSDDNGERLIWLARVAGSRLARATAQAP
jgi:hypothetical protein